MIFYNNFNNNNNNNNNYNNNNNKNSLFILHHLHQNDVDQIIATSWPEVDYSFKCQKQV